jgi:molecular chaperone DnaK
MSKSKKIIGIDLGSYNSAVSVYEGNEVKIIPNSEGGLTTPSVVSFGKDGEIKVGEPARRQAAVNPQNTIYNIKRLMGKTYEQVKDLKRPYKIVNSNGRAAVEVNGKAYSPEEISAMVIQKMKKTAEDYLGEEVDKAIITVPAHFNSEEREATKTAGEIAGLKIERVIAEPTAASLNISDSKAKKYAVYDFGGSTFDCSIVDIGDGVYEILSTNGDLDLGGSNIDQAIIDHLVTEYKKTSGVDLSKDPMSLQRLVDAAEKAKIELSSSASTDINLPYITVIDNVPQHLNINLTKAKFEQLSEPFVERTIKLTEESVKKSGLKFADIDDIILVGGSTRIPLVQQKLETLFSKTPNKSLNPDTCVSTGATIQGGVLTGQSDILLLDVLPITLGIETMGGVFTKMIETNTTIPTKREETFSTAQDNQPSVEIHVLQGERPMANGNKTLGRFHLDGIMPAPRGVPQVTVTFDVDANGILKVSAKDKASGKENSIRIEGSSSLSKEEIERMKNEAAENAESDKKKREEVDKLNSADSLIFQTDKQIKEYGDKMTEDEKSKLESILSELKDIHTNKDIDNIDSKIEELNSKWAEISTRLYQSTAEETPTDDTTTTDYEEVK